MSAGYATLVFGAQALRRMVEREAELSGALGVAAELWEHQVAQVSAVLEDVHIRHVLGDEVGLGKTVQALAIIRAVRLQRPHSRVVIVVPDELTRQWGVEALVRGGFALKMDDPGEDAELRRPVLLWPSLLKERPERWALVEAADLLVVDELAWLKKGLQEDLARAAAEIPRVLLLTATPPLSDGEQGEALLRVIEPGRASSSGEGTWAALVAREQTAARALSAEGATPTPRALQVAASVSGATRRILRTRREELGGAWPARRVRVHRFDPTPAERGRQRLLWEWMGVATDTTRDFDPVALAQRVRSPQSMRQRVTYLIGHGHDRGELLQGLRELLGPEHGDSRWEALTDLLTGLWAAEPGAKVVIGANDNLTVDHLSKALPEAFDELRGPGSPLVVARIRSQRDGPEDIVDPDDVVAAATIALQRGEAQVLLLTQQGVAGLNLQAARHVILYACPWDIEEIDQLIGRVDRIVSGALSEAGTVHAAPVTVHVLVQRGLVDDRVVTVLEAARVFHHPAAGDRDDVTALTRAVKAAGLTDGAEGWERASEAGEAVAEARAVGAAGLPLREHQADRGEARRARSERILGAPPAWPALGVSKSSGWRAREAAVHAWLSGMRLARLYNFKAPDPDSGAYTLRYFEGETRRGAAEGQVPLAVSELQGVRDTRPFTLRSHGRAVAGDLVDRHRHIELMDHGGALHDSVVRAWAVAATRRPATFELVVRASGVLGGLRGDVLQVQVGLVRAAACLPPHAATGAPSLLAGLEADERFVLGHLRGALVAAGVVLRPTGPLLPLSAEQLDALLRPDLEEATKQLRWIPEEVELPPWAGGDRARDARAQVEGSIRSQARAWWGGQQERLTAARAGRLAVLDAEVQDLTWMEDRLREAAPEDGGATRRAAELRERRSWLEAEVEVRRQWLLGVKPPSVLPAIFANVVLI